MTSGSLDIVSIAVHALCDSSQFPLHVHVCVSVRVAMDG